MNLWLDDVRVPPSEEWTWVKTAREAIDLLEAGGVTRVSLDHDLGEANEKTGYDVARFIEASAYLRVLAPLRWEVHSANPVGAARMRQALTKADHYWIRPRY